MYCYFCLFSLHTFRMKQYFNVYILLFISWVFDLITHECNSFYKKHIKNRKKYTKCDGIILDFIHSQMNVSGKMKSIIYKNVNPYSKYLTLELIDNHTMENCNHVSSIKFQISNYNVISEQYHKKVFFCTVNNHKQSSDRLLYNDIINISNWYYTLNLLIT